MSISDGRAVIAMIGARLDFISVDWAVLADCLAGTAALEVPDDFVQAASRLGGAKAELTSHMRAAAGAIAKFWKDESLPSTLRHAAAGRLLENLIRERPLDQVRMIIRLWRLIDKSVPTGASWLPYRAGHWPFHSSPIAPRSGDVTFASFVPAIVLSVS